MLNIERIKCAILLVLSGIMFSCNPAQKEKGVRIFVDKDFKRHEHLHGEVIALQRAIKPSDICVIPDKDLLLLVDMNGEYFMQAYQLSTMKYITSFAKKGNDPGQLLSCQLQYDDRTNILYITDFYNKKIYSFGVDSITSKNENITPISSVTIQTKVVDYPLVISKNKIVDFCDNFKSPKIGVFSFYNGKGDFLQTKGSFPLIQKDYDQTELNQVFTGKTSLSSNRDKILYNYYFTDFIDIYDTTGTLIKRAHGPDGFDPDLKSVHTMGAVSTGPTKKAVHGYTGKVRMKDNSLYVLYDGKPVSIEDYHTNKLFNFNDALVPQTAYELDAGIFGFDIDWSKNIIYGLSHKMGNSIIKYKIQ